MNTDYRKKTVSPSNIMKYLSLLLLFLFWATGSQAEEAASAFDTPVSLATLKPQSSEQALTLLTSNKFHQELLKLTKQLSQKDIEQANMFNKVALLSILGKSSQLDATIKAHKNATSYTHYTLHSKTIAKLPQKDITLFKTTLTNDLATSLAKLNDEDLYQTNNALGWSVSRAQDYAFNIFKRYQDKAKLNTNEAIQLIVNSHLYRVLERVIPVSQSALEQENSKRYIIEPEILITTKAGVELAATVVRKRNQKEKRPTAFQFTIYADEAAHIKTAIHAAAHGFVGVVANSRGKRSSSNKITPWVYDGEDATSVIDWITKQSWSDGSVAMYGGSYNGFTQWAAAKHMHPALKAMAPYASASLITGLPYENNIALTGNYQWAHFVTNNKTTDNSVYANWQKSNDLVSNFFESGRPLVGIPELDGKANPLFQQWLEHPSFDEFYQAMVPFQQEYAKINIPVLSVTGYFDGGQISAIDYLQRHYKYNENADHTLLIGPYGHITSQGKPNDYYSNYFLDEVAHQKDTEEIVFAWFKHVLFGYTKPSLLKDKVNYQLMGSNTWQHQASYKAMNETAVTYFLSSTSASDGKFTLRQKQEQQLAFTEQTVDMTDRKNQHNKAPWPLIQKALHEPNGLIYITDAFEKDYALAGAITGELSIAVNKKDVDIGYNFYEIDKDGNAFHLNNYRSRASFADNMSKRQLLNPNTKTIVPIINARMTAKYLTKGSRLAIVLNVNKNSDAQVNMGSGKAVNFESIEDAGEPLTIKWYNDSRINIPLTVWQ